MSDTNEQVDSNVQQVQVQLEEAKVEEVIRWLDEQIRRVKSDRGGLDQKILEWDRQYEAIPEEASKNFPWPEASNIIVPVTATAVESVMARLIGSVFGGKELWTAIAKSPEWVDLSDPLARWLNWAADNVLGMYEVCQRWFISTAKYGTGILKLPWVEHFRDVKYMTNNGLYQERIKTHDGPLPEVVRLENFLFSSDAITTQDIQSCEWVAHRTVRTYKYLKEKENAGVYTNIDQIKDYKRSSSTDTEQQMEERTGVEPSEREDYELWEVWCSYDIEGNGSLAELVITFHLDSGVPLRAVYNFYRHQERPFHIIRYMPRDNSLLGIGICQMLEDIQTEITAMHNQRIDNATLANTKVWKRRQGSGVDIEDVYPGAIIDVVEMEDIEPMDMGLTHDTLLQEEMHSNAIGEKRTGVSDYSVGRESSAIGSRATATSTMALIREGNKRFQMTIRDIRNALGNIAHQTIQLYQQFATDNKVMYELFSEEENRIVQEFFQLPEDLSYNSVRIDVPAISETENKEMERQAYLSLAGLIRQFYEGLMQVVGISENPEAPENVKKIAVHAANTSSEIFKRILESFDIADAESLAPDMEALLGAQTDLQNAVNQMGLLNGGNGNGTGQAANGPGEGAAPNTGINGEQPTMGTPPQGTSASVRNPTQSPLGQS